MIRFGIVGFGLHAVKRLMPGFQQARRCKVTALSRRNLSQAQESAKQFDIPYAFDSTAAMCASPEVDAVFVASPDALHLSDVLEAVRQKKPALCEKPMAMNSAEAQTMLDAARDAHVMLGVAHVMRYHKTVRLFREQLAAGAVGRPQLLRAEFLAPMLSTQRQWVHDPKLATGGPLADIGVHCIDSLRFILGREVVSVSAQASYDEHSPLESSAIVTLDFDNGVKAAVAVSGRTPYRTILEVAGDEAILTCTNALTIDRPVMVELRRFWEVVQQWELWNDDSFARQVDAFAAAVEEGRPFEIPAEEGLRNQQILDAAYRSIKSGRVEPVA
jgi:1,5-anhydro-D-fructose reductase (1,5-anhydro-D-mannitol-forming)